MFPPPITWYEYYKALRTGDVSKIELALLVYDAQALTTPLDSDESALEVAVKAGQVEVVRFLLSDPTFNRVTTQKRVRIFNRALVGTCLSCSSNQLTIADLLMDSDYFCLETNELEILMEMMNNASINLQIIERYLKNKYKMEIPSRIISQLVEYAILNGFYNFTKLDIVRDVDQYMTKLDPILKAIFLQDQETVKKLATCDKSWYSERQMSTAKLPSSIVVKLRRQWFHFRVNAFKYAGRVGNPDIIRTMRDYAINRYKLHDMMKEICDDACRAGHTQLVHVMWEERWVDTENEGRWSDRLILAARARHTATVCHVLDNFFVQSRPLRQPSGPVRCATMELKNVRWNDLLKQSVETNNITLLKKLIVYIKISGRKWSHSSFREAVEKGHVNIAEIYIRMGATLVTNERCMRNHSINSKTNVILLEILGTTCQCGSVLLRRKANLDSSWDCGVIIDILLRSTCERQIVLNKRDENFKAKLDLMVSYALRTLLDHYDLKLVYLMAILSANDAGKRSVFSICQEICDMYATTTGRPKGLLCFGWRELLDGIKKLDEENQLVVRQMIYEGGVTVADGATDALPGATGQSDLLLPVVISLKSSCRLSIRRSIRHAYPIGSMRDMVLTLYTAGHLPRTLVSYLLLRGFNYSCAVDAVSNYAKCKHQLDSGRIISFLELSSSYNRFYKYV